MANIPFSIETNVSLHHQIDCKVTKKNTPISNYTAKKMIA